MIRSVVTKPNSWFAQVQSLLRFSQLEQGLWDEIEELLILADVGVGMTEKLTRSLKQLVKEKRVSDREELIELLKKKMVLVLEEASRGYSIESTEGRLVVLLVGVNGSGKTTTIAKLANKYKSERKIVLIGAADTFRAAAIDQINEWGKRLQVDVIAHQQGADPGSVVFDTISAANSRSADVVIIDTAGRLHTNKNLMEEIKKIRRVIVGQGGVNQLRVLLTLDATTGQNGLIQARSFSESLGCDGVFLTKLDGSSKGGIVLAVAHELKLPVLYIGTGELIEDIARFESKAFIDAMFD